MSWVSFIIAVVLLFTFPLKTVMSRSAQNKAMSVPFLEYESNEPSELGDLILMFSKVEESSLKQSWLSAPELGFSPTGVKVV